MDWLSHRISKLILIFLVFVLIHIGLVFRILVAKSGGRGGHILITLFIILTEIQKSCGLILILILILSILIQIKSIHKPTTSSEKSTGIRLLRRLLWLGLLILIIWKHGVFLIEISPEEASSIHYRWLGLGSLTKQRSWGLILRLILVLTEQRILVILLVILLGGCEYRILLTIVAGKKDRLRLVLWSWGAKETPTVILKKIVLVRVRHSEFEIIIFYKSHLSV